MPELRSVVVTGRGWLLPPGMTPAGFEDDRSSRAAGWRLDSFDAASYVGDPKVLRAMNRVFQIAAAAAVLAMRPAGLVSPSDLERAGHEPARCGIAVAMTEISPVDANLIDAVVGIGTGDQFDLGAFGEAARHSLHPFRRLMLLANMAAAHSSLLFGLQGPSFTFNSGAHSSLQAIREACWTIASGRADLMLCEAADSPENALHCQPVTEAAAALVLEAEESARRRGATLLACLQPGPEPSAPALDAAPAQLWRRHAPATAGLLAVLARLSQTGAARLGELPGLEIVPCRPAADAAPLHEPSRASGAAPRKSAP